MLDLNFNLNSINEMPLYMQIYSFLTEQIRSGRLKEGEKLPGKRTLAGELGVSVNTIDTAYQMLAAEGFVAGKERSGFYVLKFDELISSTEMNTESVITSDKKKSTRYLYDLSTSRVDTSLFPTKTWARIGKELLYNADFLLEHGDGQGELYLRQQLSYYLSAYRGVKCVPEQIVIGAGVEYLIGLISGILPVRRAGVENPGYKKADVILENSGMSCEPIPVDENGISIEKLKDSDAEVCYVTPSHQFPTGTIMPAWRRTELLKWAMSGSNRFIIEDDYDSEFRFDTRPLPSLQGMSVNGEHVIYMSTFSRCLAPGIRIAYMVLPFSLLNRYRDKYCNYSCTVSRIEQHTLAAFIESGHFTRHLARMRNKYRIKCNTLIAALQESFENDGLVIHGQHTGIHFLLELNNGMSEEQMLLTSEIAGIKMTGLSSYYYTDFENCPKSTVLIGYGAVSESDAAALSSELKKIWN